MTISRVVALVMCGVPFCACTHEIDHRQNAQYENELEDLSQATPNDLRQLFFIRLFDGFFPIPNRYAIISQPGATNGKLEFSSSVHLLLSDKNVIPKELDTFGLITVGNYADYLKENEPQTGTFPTKTKTISKHGLTIELIETIDGVLPKGRARLVLIHDGGEYLVISDANNQLWEVLVEVYARMNDKI